MLPLLPYHHLTAEFLKQQKSVWEFFASQQHREEQLKEFKTDLLKNTYKFDESSDAALFQKVQLAKEKLRLSLPVYLYQAQHSEEMNASIVYLNNEAHIVFSGKILQVLNDPELQAIIAHELSHIHLYTQLDGEAEVTDRIITAIANHPGTTAAHYETARLFKLYTEIYCDRGAYLVTGDYGPIISSLVKIATGLQSVNPESYIKQAEEIFATDATTKATGVSHPENFIRARAIWLWHTQGQKGEPVIQEMIEGNMQIDELDLFRQHRISEITRHLILALLNPSWMRTPLIVSLSKQYFGDIEPSEIIDTGHLGERASLLHSNLQDYLAYVLYDFATVDKALEDIPLGYSFYLADELKIDKSFANVVKKERKLTDKKTNTLKKQTLSAYHEQGMTTA